MKIAKALAVGYVATIAGVALYAYIDPRGAMKSARKGRKEIEEKTGARLPRPDIIVVGPEDGEEFDDFDEVLCETALEVNIELPELLASDQKAFVEETAKRALAKMLPDYPWPATSGDHPSAAELQGMVKYEIHRSILDETLCLSDEDFDVEEEDEEVEEDFVPPPAGEQV